ncbi:abhydrolase domain-containing 18 [Paenibacillus mesophilus]|uniref:alpha/beta hydrolase n=1 Tax=Paenibacillus mesophilus TaxID=2582849 RepID=UPI00110E615D|nr:alpha/beta hydrolase family protein [Paenibacillus mesophilus]TMV46257.1 abhydrolase domain-containing 18 [Paenibacillus mesophilus]
MKSIISKAIDRFALHILHKTRSKHFQYSAPPAAMSESMEKEIFYNADGPSNVIFDFHRFKDGYHTGTFSYRSLLATDDPLNDISAGEVLINHNEAAPNVIFVHGWRMSSFDRIKSMFQKQLMDDLGWNPYYFTLPYHVQRKPDLSLYSGEYMVSADIGRTIQAVRQAVIDLRTLIGWIKANKKGPVIVIGVSLGGFLTNLTALVEPRIDAMVSIFYANRLSYSIWNTIPGKYIRTDLEHHGVNYGDLVRYWKITEPSQSVPVLQKDRILLISAKNDLYVHIEDADYLWEAWDRPARHVYNCGHAGIVLHGKAIARDALSFVQQKIRG